MTDIRSLARALGGDVANRCCVTCPGPSHSARDRSLSVTFDADAPDGFLVNSFAGDDWQDCRDHVRALLGLGSLDRSGRDGNVAPPISHRPCSPSPETVQRREYALSLWQEARPIGGTLAERYLIARGVVLTGEAFTGRALRFHPACPFRLDSNETIRPPAMLGAMTSIETGDFQGIHRTALQADGSGKAKVRGLDNPKKMLGSSRGACIRLSPDDSVTTGLALAEGIETALSVMGNFGISPAWAALSAGMVAQFPILSGIDCLSLFADNDAARVLPSGKVVRPGHDAAHQCAERWAAAGRECVIWTPPDIGSDFNDLSGRIAA